MHRIARLAFAALALLPFSSLLAKDPMRQVDIVVDMTPEGRKILHPTPEKPAYYYPIVGGYKEMGALVSGEKPPLPSSVVHLVAVELAKQGYVTCLRQVPAAPDQPAHMAVAHQPDLLVVVFWGYLNPQIDDFGTDPTDPTTKVFFNQNQMLALVGGNTLNHLDMNFEREDVMQAAEDDRYFVSISAYDAQAPAGKDGRKKKILLWQAKMSVPSNGVDFSTVMTALVTAGGPLLGRETTRPKMLMAPLTPEGHVEVGTPTVKDYQDAPYPARPATPPATATSQSPSPTASTPPAHTPQ